MRILDRYILKSVLAIFFSCLFTFIFLYIIIDVFSHLEDILRQRIAAEILIKYYLSYLPIIFVQVCAFCCLLATLYTFGRLNRDNEIIGMRASGLSIFSITKTVIIFGVIASVFVFYINDRFVPMSMALTGKIKSQMEVGSKKAQGKEQEDIYNLAMYGLKNRLFFVNKFSPLTNTMEGIVILEHDRHQNITKKIVANSGVFKDGGWKFYESITYHLDENGQLINEPIYNKEEVMDIPETPEEFLNQRQTPDIMTISQLKGYINKLYDSGATAVVRNLKIDLYRKFSEPQTAIIITLLGIPFALRIRKRGIGLTSFGLAIIMGFLYYVVGAVGIALGKAGILAPLVAVSLNHIIAISLSLYLISNMP